jgi:hypothetical protein
MNDIRRYIDQIISRQREHTERLDRLQRAVVRPSGWTRRLPGSRLYRFVLAGDMEGESEQTAEIRAIDDSEQISAAEPVVNTLGQFDHLETGNTGICARMDGALYAILPTEGGSGTDTQLTLVTFTLDEDLAVGAAQLADATVVATSDEVVAAVSSSITLTSHGQWRAQTGAAGMALLAGADWWIVYLEQRPAQILGEFSTGLLITDASKTLSNPVALDAWPNHDLPSTLTAHNPHKHHCIDGDKAIVTWNEDQERYEVTDILPIFAKRFWFKLKTNQSWPDGYKQSVTDTEAEATIPASGFSGDLPTGVDFGLLDQFGLCHNARGDDGSQAPADMGVAEYNMDEDTWIVIHCTHRATKCLGTLASAFSGTPATFDVAVPSDGGLDGTHPNDFGFGGTTNVTVQNKYSWESGDSGGEIKIYRDPRDGNWYPDQMECPN